MIHSNRARDRDTQGKPFFARSVITAFGGKAMGSFEAQIEHYLDAYRLGHEDEAFHGLRCLGSSAISGLQSYFAEEADASVRALLLDVISQYRDEGTVPFMAATLYDRDSKVWREALDGLVSIGGRSSLEALRRVSASTQDPDRLRWLNEAIDQVSTGTKSK